MVGCGQQRGRMGTRAPTEPGNQALTGRSGDGSWGGWGVSKRAPGEAGGRAAGGADFCDGQWSVRGAEGSEAGPGWCPWVES